MVLVLIVSACANQGGVGPGEAFTTTTTTAPEDPGSPFEPPSTTSTSTSTTTTEPGQRLESDDRDEVIDAARGFGDALAAADWDAISQALTGAPDDVGQFFQDTWEALVVEKVSTVIIADRPDAETPEVDVGITLDLRDAGEWDYVTTLSFTETPDGWAVEWDPSIIHPGMEEGDTLQLAAEWPERAPILDINGETIVSQAPVSIIGVVPERITDLDTLLEALEDLAGIEPDVVTTELNRPAVQPDWFLPVGEMPTAAYEQIAPALEDIGGVLTRASSGRAAAIEPFADFLIGTVGPITAELLALFGPPYDANDVVGRSGLELALQQDLAGLPDLSVIRVNQFGRVEETLASRDGEPPSAAQTTLDIDLQLAATEALATHTDLPAAMVVLDIDTGGIRAAATQPLTDFDRALGGLYPPGSTFKIITATALLADQIGPGDEVACPETVTINGRVFRNADERDLGTVEFRRAFAESCNTTFSQLSGILDDGELKAWAEVLGFNTDYGLPIPFSESQFPAPPDLATRAAAAIGQAQVLASPLQMASVAAAIANGGWRAPTILATGDLPELVPIDAGVAETMRELMLYAVTEGTGSKAQVAGQIVRGKTGSAEFGVGDDLPTHAWFVGYWDELAFAVVVEGGGSGGNDAAPIVATFIELVLAGPTTRS